MIKTNITIKLISFIVMAVVSMGLFYSCPCLMDLQSDIPMDCCKTMPHCDPTIGGVKETKSFIAPSSLFNVYKAQDIFFYDVPFFVSSLNNPAEQTPITPCASPPPTPLFARNLNLRF